MVKQTQSSNQTQLFSPAGYHLKNPRNCFLNFAFSSFPNIHNRQDEANLSTTTTYHNFLFHSSILPASQRKILPFATLPPSKSRVFFFTCHSAGSNSNSLPRTPKSQTPHLPWKLAWKERCPWWSMQNGPRPRRLTRRSRYIPRGMMDRTRTDIHIMFNPFRIHGNWYINPTTSLLFIKINQL